MYIVKLLSKLIQKVFENATNTSDSNINEHLNSRILSKTDASSNHSMNIHYFHNRDKLNRITNKSTTIQIDMSKLMIILVLK